METVNCIRCGFRHKDNGNCTAVGGFCTAVPAAHCPMLQEYLDTGLTPEQCENAKIIIRSAFSNDTSKAERILELLKATDVAPVRHGRWETNSDRPDTLICSICRCGFDMWKHDPHNYCPNCGSKMDLEALQ